jgi:fumarylacetoacetase
VTSSWLGVAPDSPFGPQTLPYGTFSVGSSPARVGVRIGESVLDVGAVAHELAPSLATWLAQPSLDALLAAGPSVWADVRSAVTAWVTTEANRPSIVANLHALGSVTLSLPFTVADYVDFYSSRQHAENLGTIFRPGQPALTPNWPHLPIGYHGRAGTVVVSGTDVRRPCGQTRAPDAELPTFGPARRLDIEAEVGFVVGIGSRLGDPIAVGDFAEHVFGVVLVNDWSARDLQAWEYVPLGPFLGKSFATTVSAWVTPLAAFEQARMRPPDRDVALLPYLRDDDHPWGLDITLEVQLNGQLISRPPFAGMYWTPAQQLAHLTVNGASARTGDLFASGAVSGSAPDQLGSLIELSWNGQRPLRLANGDFRTFLEDRDEVVIRATAPGPEGTRVGIGEARGRILPAAASQ